MPAAAWPFILLAGMHSQMALACSKEAVGGTTPSRHRLLAKCTVFDCVLTLIYPHSLALLPAYYTQHIVSDVAE